MTAAPNLRRGVRDRRDGSIRRALASLALCLATAVAAGQTPASSKPAASQPDLSLPSLSQALADYFPVGAAIWKGDIAGPHAELLKRHFNSIVAENDMKWARLRPDEATFRFDTADALVRFAKANHMLVRGHTLLWHRQNPGWLFLDANGNDMQPSPENKALLLRRLEQHIRGVVGHFRDDVYAWDVVNEVIDPTEPDGFRRSPWFRITGTEYIDTAFRVAHETAPKARLFLNDYDTTNPVKRKFLLALVRDLKSRGVPIDGVGHQMHSNIKSPSPEAVVETINLFAALGVENQITELDISVYTKGTDDDTDKYEQIPPDLLARQGERYRDLFQAFRQLKGKIAAVTFWGYADDHTWLKHWPVDRLDLPLPFDEHLQAKPAFWGIVDPARLPAEKR